MFYRHHTKLTMSHYDSTQGTKHDLRDLSHTHTFMNNSRYDCAHPVMDNTPRSFSTYVIVPVQDYIGLWRALVVCGVGAVSMGLALWALMEFETIARCFCGRKAMSSATSYPAIAKYSYLPTHIGEERSFQSNQKDTMLKSVA